MSMKPYSGEVDEKDVATHRRWIKQCYAIYGYIFLVIGVIGMLCDISFDTIVSLYLVIILPKFAIGTVHLPSEAKYRSLKTAHNRLHDTLSGGFANYVRYSVNEIVVKPIHFCFQRVGD